MYVLKLLITLVLLLLPFGELLRFEVGNHIALKPLDIMVVITTVWWGLFRLKRKKKKITWYLFAFPTIALLSLLYNLTWLQPNEFLVSFLYLVRWVAYFSLFPIILQFDTAFKKKLAVILFFDGFFLVLAGFIQYFFYNSLKNLFYLGWDEHMHRIFSTFFDPNFAGAFYVLYFLFLCGGIQYFLKKKKKKIVLLLSFVLSLTLLALFLTFSRAAIIMLFVGSVTYFTLIQKKKLVALILGAIVLFAVLASSQFNDENMNLLRRNSGISRLDNLAVALRIIQDHPLIGVGFNAYRYTKELYGLDHDWTNASSHADAGVDNSFLFVLATTGIIGLITYGWLWWWLLKNAFYIYKKKIQIGAVVVIASAFALFSNALFINSLFFAPLMLWIWMMWGLMEEY